jgi:DNA polymerase III epsilon subunit-like protein
LRTYVVDLETTDLRSDIGTLIVASFGRLDDDDNIAEMMTQTIRSVGRGSVERREKMLARFARDRWAEADIIIGQNHIGFDRHFLDGVLFRNNDTMVPKRLLIDTYQTAKGKFAMGSSMANMVDVFGVGKKDAPSKDDWRKANVGDKAALERIRERCESDVKMTAELWKKLKGTYMEYKGR